MPNRPDVSSAAATVNARRAVKAKHIVTVDRSSGDVFAIARSWVNRLPDVELVNEIAGELIAWKTVASSQLKHAGSVNVESTKQGGTEVRIEIDYEPPGVAFGMLFDDLTNKLLA